MEREFDVLAALDAGALGDRATVVELQRVVARAQALATRAVGAFDAGRAWADDQARSAAGWLAAQTRIPAATARQLVRTARQLRHMPATDAAFVAGEINEAHVRLLTGARTPATEAALARDEAFLVDQARQHRFATFARVLASWRQAADPDGTERDAHRQHHARRLHLSQTWEGMWVLDGLFDPVSGAAIAEALRRVEDELFDADWAAAKAALGRPITVSDLARTQTQRRADALVELVARAGTTPRDGKRPEPLFSVYVGYETFHGRICQLADGTVVSLAALDPWLTPSLVERVVFAPDGRVLELGERTRLYRGAARRAVVLRDRECFHPMCDQPAERCEIDHIVPYAQGGPTTVDNGRPACSHHNRHRGGPAP